MAGYRRLGFSGLLRSGKDHIAGLLKFQPVSFAEPLYKLCEYVYGSCDKNNPRHRKFLQWVGQCGWGCHDEQHCPDDFDKAAITILLRREGSAIYPHRDWPSFGRRSDFWVVDLLDRVKCFHQHQNIVVTNVRFRHELEPMKAGGFEHYLVLCSEETRRARYWNDPAKSVIPIPVAIDLDTSEAMARELAAELPDNRIIWNDEVRMPAGKKYLTVEQFMKGLGHE